MFSLSLGNVFFSRADEKHVLAMNKMCGPRLRLDAFAFDSHELMTSDDVTSDQWFAMLVGKNKVRQGSRVNCALLPERNRTTYKRTIRGFNDISFTSQGNVIDANPFWALCSLAQDMTWVVKSGDEFSHLANLLSPNTSCLATIENDWQSVVKLIEQGSISTEMMLGVLVGVSYAFEMHKNPVPAQWFMNDLHPYFAHVRIMLKLTQHDRTKKQKRS